MHFRPSRAPEAGRPKRTPGAQARRVQWGGREREGQHLRNPLWRLAPPPVTERVARGLWQRQRRQPPAALAPRSRAQRGAARGCRDHPGPLPLLPSGPGELLPGLAGTGRRGHSVATKACPLAGWTPCKLRAASPGLSSDDLGGGAGVWSESCGRAGACASRKPYPGPCPRLPSFAARGHRPVTPAPLLPLWREGGGRWAVGLGRLRRGGASRPLPEHEGTASGSQALGGRLVASREVSAQRIGRVGLGKVESGQTWSGVCWGPCQMSLCHTCVFRSSFSFLYELLPNCSYSEWYTKGCVDSWPWKKTARWGVPWSGRVKVGGVLNRWIPGVLLRFIKRRLSV